MTYLDAILLTCFRTFNGDRSRSAIYHLLTGKKTSQTIQDAHLYGVSNLFQTLPKLSRAYFDERCEFLIEEKFVQELQDQRFSITKKGNSRLVNYFQDHPFPSYLNGWIYHDRAMVFWKRLNLLVQSASNIRHKEKSFYPVQRDPDIQRWVRETFVKWGEKRNKKIAEFHQELITLCQREDFPDHPEFIINRLSGYQLIGLTIDQISQHFQIEQVEVHYRFLHSLHYCMIKIQNQPLLYPLLFGLLQDLMNQSIRLTSSTKKTFSYIEKGLSLTDIATVRNLKESTIEDHIIELALMIPTFDIIEFVPKDLQDDVWLTAKKINHRRLREFKEEIPAASYFQIRLVLVKRGREDEKWKNYSSKNLATDRLEKVKRK
ncbi:helix-turn-helix domain-containing protein [Jeotgalibacillus marinus]|uniref:Helix-turn-helix domain-containing protein n=1 Tax=Jeotgalibacillus marinus TaxID=86667 RepID=A0ABV3PYS8_9BACL